MWLKCLATPLNGLAYIIVLFAFFQQIPHHFFNIAVSTGFPTNTTVSFTLYSIFTLQSSFFYKESRFK